MANRRSSDPVSVFDTPKHSWSSVTETVSQEDVTVDSLKEGGDSSNFVALRPDRKCVPYRAWLGVSDESGSNSGNRFVNNHRSSQLARRKLG